VTGPAAGPNAPGRVLFRFNQVAGLPPVRLLVGAATVFVGLSAWAMAGETATADELIHLYAGYRYWREGDFSVNPEHPPLAKLLMAAPLLFREVKVPGERDPYVFFYQCGNDPDALLGIARAMNVGWGLVILVTVYSAARELYGARGALLSLLLATFCPLVLAHGHLVTTDVPVAALSLLTLRAFQKTYGNLTVRRCLACGALLGLTLATKFSAVFLIPVLAWSWGIAHVRRVRAGRTADPQKPWDEALRVRTLGRVAGAVVLAGAVSLGIVWASYGFRFKASPDPEHAFGWDFQQLRGSATLEAVQVARQGRLLPESYLFGYLYVQENAVRRRAFALGQYSDTGWIWYFPFAMLVKTPAPTLVLMAWGAVAWFRWNRTRPSGEDYLIIPTIVYGVLSVASNLNIGVRHLLPIYPLLLILAGSVPLPDPGTAAAPRWKTLLPLFLAGATVVETLSDAPYFLAFFNVPARAAAARHSMLVDSNLDWGQDLGRLKQWMDRRGIARIKLSYFGNGSPRHLRLDHEILPGANLYRWYEREWKETREIRPGDTVAVSASNFVGALVDEDRDFFRRRLGHLRPVAAIGHSILVFQVPAP
jgi:hypothetical protein